MAPFTKLILIGALSACTPYTPGTIHQSIEVGTEAVHVVGCLDIAVRSHPDTAAEGPAVQIAFGNHCRGPAIVDLGAIRARLRYRDGQDAAMAVYDPQGVIRPAVLDARTQGTETLEYHPARPAADGGIADRLCLDLSRIDRRRPSPEPVITCVAVDPVWMLAGAKATDTPEEDSP